MTFDEVAYRKNVLTPFSKDTYRGDLLVKVNSRAKFADSNSLLVDLADLDLVTLLDVPAQINSHVLKNHLQDITGLLRKNQTTKTAQNLLFLLDELPKRPTDPVNLADPQIWLTLQQERAKTATRKIEKLANSIAKHNPLNVISETELKNRLIAKGLSTEYSAKLNAAVVARGVAITKDITLPNCSISIGLAKAINDAIQSGSARSLAGLLSPQNPLINFSVADRFRAIGAQVDFGPDNVAQAYSAATRAANSDYTEAVKKVTNSGNLGALEWDAEALHQLALQLAIDLALERRSRGDDADEMVSELKLTGLIDIDARRIVAKALTADSGIILTGVVSGDVNEDAQTSQLAEVQAPASKSEAEKPKQPLPVGSWQSGIGIRPSRTNEPSPAAKAVTAYHAANKSRPSPASAVNNSVPRQTESQNSDPHAVQCPCNRCRPADRKDRTSATTPEPKTYIPLIKPFCTNCGRRNEPPRKFCTGCGSYTGRHSTNAADNSGNQALQMRARQATLASVG